MVHVPGTRPQKLGPFLYKGVSGTNVKELRKEKSQQDRDADDGGDPVAVAQPTLTLSAHDLGHVLRGRDWNTLGGVLTLALVQVLQGPAHAVAGGADATAPGVDAKRVKQGVVGWVVGGGGGVMSIGRREVERVGALEHGQLHGQLHGSGVGFQQVGSDRSTLVMTGQELLLVMMMMPVDAASDHVHVVQVREGGRGVEMKTGQAVVTTRHLVVLGRGGGGHDDDAALAATQEGGLGGRGEFLSERGWAKAWGRCEL